MRPPEVFVRELAPAEGQRLKRLSKQSKLLDEAAGDDLAASNTLMSAPEIARMLLTDESHVRKVIHDFNRHGFESLRPRFRGGRPRRISTDDEPDRRGRRRPSRHARGALHTLEPGQALPLPGGRGSRSRRRTGRILARNGISLQRTRSWKQSPDPDYGPRRRGSSPSTANSPKTAS